MAERSLVGQVRSDLAGRTSSVPHSAQIVRSVRDSDAAPVDHDSLLRVSELVEADLVGAGPLQPLLNDPAVSDVVVNGVDGVWVDRGDGLERVDVLLGGEDDVRSLACRLAAVAGRRLDDGNPFVDVRMADGTRFHAMLRPVAGSGPYLSFRTHRSRAFTLAQLVECQTLTEALAGLLHRVVRARLPFLVTGGTGTGKTTLLASLLSLANDSERLVLVEDAAELRPDHPHVISLEARPANVEGQGVVTLADLVRESLRMRPDRVIVGECRGAEVTELLAALNTGHDGGAGTLHCNAAADVPARLEALTLPHGLSRAGLHAQLEAALRVVVHLRRDGNRRVVGEVGLLQTGSEGLSVRTAFHRSGEGAVYGELERLLRERGA
ncbi:TadA family conjugal transfer-associated ATPase [Natronoglycomyces albus]|uniref:TadA family conjugal transfer-associated ATPase n=1 Tax=Natronoglycomyces albus TaxID=2811108 RepID=A0A895XJD5_9ACTN|nr:TadA family conjugal transfer-associated ATPase [Natronoglycomyces albus]QSB05454.1 TadA family conjugal transfer-associated ATPase [Natronoglycomyces albus]